LIKTIREANVLGKQVELSVVVEAKRLLAEVLKGKSAEVSDAGERIESIVKESEGTSYAVPITQSEIQGTVLN